MEQKFKRSFDELGNIVAMTEAVFLEAGLDPDLRNVVDLATEELFESKGEMEQNINRILLENGT